MSWFVASRAKISLLFLRLLTLTRMIDNSVILLVFLGPGFGWTSPARCNKNSIGNRDSAHPAGTGHGILLERISTEGDMHSGFGCTSLSYRLEDSSLIAEGETERAEDRAAA